MKTYYCRVTLPVYLERTKEQGTPTKKEIQKYLSKNIRKILPSSRIGECREAPAEHRKTFIINLNPKENPRVGYLNMGLLYNPFPRSAVGYGGSGGFGWSREMEIRRHLRDGVSLEHAKWLLGELLTEEARDIVLHGMKGGERREVVVVAKANKGEVLRRSISKEEMNTLKI